MYKFNYKSLRVMPTIVKTMTFNFDGWIVGNAALYCCDIIESIKDWDKCSNQ